MEILMVVGSESGNAEMVADCLGERLEELGHVGEIACDGDLSDWNLEQRELILIISSTTGIGDIPQNIEPLFDDLAESRPDLSHLRFGVVGLGDRNYKESFCGGPEKWDKLLQSLGADRVGDPLYLDATDNPMPDEDAVTWLPTWLELV